MSSKGYGFFYGELGYHILARKLHHACSTVQCAAMPQATPTLQPPAAANSIHMLLQLKSCHCLQFEAPIRTVV